MATTAGPNLYLNTATPGWSALPRCVRDVFTDIVGSLTYSACTYTNVPVTDIISCFCHTVRQSISSNLYGQAQYHSCPNSDLPCATNFLNAYCTANDRGQPVATTLAPSYDTLPVTASAANPLSYTSPYRSPPTDSAGLAPGSIAAIVFAILFVLVTIALVCVIMACMYCWSQRNTLRRRGSRSGNSQSRVAGSTADHVNEWLGPDERAR